MAFILLCHFTKPFYEYIVYAYFLGSCVGTAVGILGVVAVVETEKWGLLAWALGALWAITTAVTVIAVCFICNHSSIDEEARRREGRDGGGHYESLELEEGRSSEETIIGEEGTEMKTLEQGMIEDRECMIEE